MTANKKSDPKRSLFLPYMLVARIIQSCLKKGMFTLCGVLHVQRGICASSRCEIFIFFCKESLKLRNKKDFFHIFVCRKKTTVNNMILLFPSENNFTCESMCPDCFLRFVCKNFHFENHSFIIFK